MAGGRKTASAAGIIDRRSVETTQSAGVAGYVAGKRMRMRKGHIVADRAGLPVAPRVHGAGIQGRDGAPDVPPVVVARYRGLRPVFAQGGYGGPGRRDALKAAGRWAVRRKRQGMVPIAQI